MGFLRLSLTWLDRQGFVVGHALAAFSVRFARSGSTPIWLSTSADRDEVFALQMQAGFDGILAVISVDIVAERLKPVGIAGVDQGPHRSETACVPFPDILHARVDKALLTPISNVSSKSFPRSASTCFGSPHAIGDEAGGTVSPCLATPRRTFRPRRRASTLQVQNAHPCGRPSRALAGPGADRREHHAKVDITPSKCPSEKGRRSTSAS